MVSRLYIFDVFGLVISRCCVSISAASAATDESDDVCVVMFAAGGGDVRQAVALSSARAEPASPTEVRNGEERRTDVMRAGV